MAASAFDNKSVEPTRQDLDEVLSESSVFLTDIEEYLRDQCGEFTSEWKFYGKKAGWTVAYVHKGRRIFHMIPQTSLFTVVFVLGKGAVSVCRDSSLPESIKSSIESAREYVEGRSVRVEIHSAEDVSNAKRLVAIKLAS
jgi:hypothetical protein